MKLFDLHSDSIIVMNSKESDLYCTETHISLAALSSFEKWCQTFAIFVPDSKRGQAAEEFFDLNYNYFQKMMEKFATTVEQVKSSSDIEKIVAKGKCAAILSIEGGAVLAGKLENVQKLVDKNVKMLTLTWNGENEIASGSDTQKGFTDFGREAVRLMEEKGILVDVSHLNDVGFDQITSIAKKPLVATHSNSRAICSHKRNLTDEQFSYIAKNKGLVGLNLYQLFISDTEKAGTRLNLMKHVYHLLEIGGENTLACGSDFDGADIHSELDSPVKFGKFADYMREAGISQEVVDKIMYNNALRFFQENLN